MWAISQGNPAMEIAYFERMGLNGLSSNPLILLEGQVVERERRKQPIGACPITFSLPHFPFYPLCFPLFSISFLIPIFPIFFFIFLSCYFPYSLLASRYSCCFSLYTAKAFYTACREEFYCFIPQLLLTCCVCPSQMVLVCQVLSHHHYPVLATNTFHFHIKEFCFVFLLSVASPTG